MNLLLASNNAKKRRELGRILGAQGRLHILVPADLGIDLEPVEDGATFLENARIKALAFSARVDMLVLADDSGLEVAALQGEPGVRSARFAGDHATDAENRALLLTRLAAVPPPLRQAAFRCAIAIARRGTLLFEAVGACPGRILDEERGALGFGYDPLFFHEASGRTFAELDEHAKDRISHRGVALAEVSAFLQKVEV